MPHREWNPKKFFRHLTHSALQLLQTWAGVNLKVDGDEKRAGEHAYTAWKALPEGARVRFESQLRMVNDMSSQHARPYLERLAQTVWPDNETTRAWSARELAFQLFIAAPSGFAKAHQLYAIDSMEHYHEYQGRRLVSLAPSPHTKTMMKQAMAEHFCGSACGSNCQVEDFVNDEKLALFVFHEDEMTSFDQFNGQGTLEVSWRRPVVRLAAVFHFETSTLQVKAPRRAEREKLRDLFAALVIGDPEYFVDAAETSKFCFAPLRDPGFDFPTRLGDQIESVSLVQVVARPAHEDFKRVTVDVKPGKAIERVRHALREIGVDLDTNEIEAIRLRFCFAGGGRSRHRTVGLSNPNSSNLNDTERDRLIRRYLQEWGINANSAVDTAVVEAAQ